MISLEYPPSRTNFQLKKTPHSTILVLFFLSEKMYTDVKKNTLSCN